MRLLILFFLINMLSSCEEKGGCLKRVGPETTHNIDAENIEHIIVYSGFNIRFEYAQTEELKIITGENYLENILIDTRNNKVLGIYDQNNCKFLKGYNMATIVIRSPFLNRIDNFGSGTDVKTLSPWTTNQLRLSSTGHSSTWLIEMDNTQLQIISNDISTFTISGATIHLDAQFPASDSRLNAGNLTVERALLEHNGSNDMLVNPSHLLSGSLKSTGNIVYFGNPNEVNIDVSGRGSLIKK